jgi:hypothetical protein
MLCLSGKKFTVKIIQFRSAWSLRNWIREFLGRRHTKVREHCLKDIVQDIELEDGGVLRKLGVVGYMLCIGDDTLVVHYLCLSDSKPLGYLRIQSPNTDISAFLLSERHR